MLSFLSASMHAVMRLFFERVCPNVFEYTFSTPASFKIFAHSCSMISPLPFGAGIYRMRTDPHLPSTSQGMLWASLVASSHEPAPRRILNKLNFALRIAFSRAGTVSLLLPNPTPTYPSLFPTTAMQEKLGLFPSGVFF